MWSDSYTMKRTGRMASLLLGFVIVAIGLTGCLGGGDYNGEGTVDISDNAGDMIITQDDLPEGWYAYSWEEMYGSEYPLQEVESGSMAISYFSDYPDAWNATQWLVVAVLDFDDLQAANSWFDEMKDQYEQMGYTTHDMDVGEEGFYVDENDDGTNVYMVFRSLDICVFMNYSSTVPHSIDAIIDFAHLQEQLL